MSSSSSSSSSAFYHTRTLRHFRSAITVASFPVSSRLDYANSLLFDIPQKNIDRLQRVQNIHSPGLLLVTFTVVAPIHSPPSASSLAAPYQPAHWIQTYHTECVYEGCCQQRPFYF